MNATAEFAHYELLGIRISALTLPQAAAAIVGVRGSLRKGYVCCGTAYGLVEAQHDAELREAFNGSWLTTADGMPLVWLAPKRVGRVYGPDLMLAVCDAGRAVGLRHYLFGGRAGVADELATRLRARFPGIEIIGQMTPPFAPAEDIDVAALRADLAQTRPDVVWVGLGTPKQERIMAEHWRTLDAGVLIGVGAAFDFHAGRVRQAPRWIRGSGFEWLFRFCMEPRRLGWRYLRTNPQFVAYVLAEKMGWRRKREG